MSRVERLLKAIIQNGSYDEERLSRVEDILYSFLKNNEYTEDPMSRMEALLITLKNSGAYSDDILSRIEAILKAKIDGTEYPHEPRSRVEELLLIWDVISEYEVYVTGIPPLTLKDSVGKNLVEWSITGNTEQASGTYTGTAKEVTAVGIEDTTEYPYFNTTDFENVAVGDKVNFSDSKLSYAMEAKKIESSNVYFENLGVDGNASGETPLVLESSSGKDLKSWSITGNTVQDGEPSPDNPIEVKGTGDKAENLFTDKTIYHNTIGEDSFWYASSTSSSVMVEVQPNTKYYIKTNTVLPIFRVGLSRNRPDVLSKFNETYRLTNTNTLEITTGDNINYLVFQGSQSLEGTWLNELYVGQGYKIDVVSRGKNLFDLNKYYGSVATVSGNSVIGRVVDIHKVNINDCFEIGKTYTFSCNAECPVETTFIRLEAEQNGGFIRSNIIRSGESGFMSMTFTPTNDCVLRITYGSGSTGVATWSDIQLELGSTATEYEPYIEPITTPIYLNSPLMSDETLDSTGKREKEFGKYVFTGDENIGKNLESIIYFQIDGAKSQFEGSACTHYIFRATSGSLQGYCYWSTVFNGRIVFTDNRSIEDFKSFLKSEYDAGHPVTVWYPLATPTSETVDVPQIPTFAGNCTIDTDTEVQPKNMTAEYTKSIDFAKPVNRSYSISYPSPTHISEVKGTGDKTRNLWRVPNYELTVREFRDAFNSETANIRYTENMQYTLSFEGIAKKTVGIGLCKFTFAYSDGTNKVSGWLTDNTAPHFSFSSDAGKTVSSLTVTNYNSPDDLEIKNIMLNEGSTALPYEPYGYKIPVVSRGKNLWDSTSKTTNESGVERFGCEYPAGTYYIINDSNINYYWRDDGIPGSKSFAPGSSQIAIATNRLVIWGGLSTTLITVYDNIPITTPIYLNSPFMADEVLKSDGNREVEWGKKDIIIENTTLYDGHMLGICRFNSSDVVPSTDMVIRQKSVCDRAPRGSASIVGSFYVNNVNIVFVGSESDTINELKDRYDGAVVYYPLATPTSETVDVPQIPTLRGNSVIDIDTALLPKNVRVTYLSGTKDTDMTEMISLLSEV